MLKQAGDREAALQCYQKANVPQKVIEGLAAKGDFAALTQFSGQQVSGLYFRHQYKTLDLLQIQA